MKYFLFSNLKNLPVASITSNEKIGRIFQTIIDLNQLEIIGFMVKKNLFLSGKFVGYFEVIEIEKQGITINSEDQLAPLDEVVRAKQIIKSGFSIISLPVYTQKRKYIGKIFDFVFCLPSGKIYKFYIKLFWDTRIIARENIISINKKKMIVESDRKILGASQPI